jgi:hypothetical protein
MCPKFRMGCDATWRSIRVVRANQSCFAARQSQQGVEHVAKPIEGSENFVSRLAPTERPTIRMIDIEVKPTRLVKSLCRGDAPRRVNFSVSVANQRFARLVHDAVIGEVDLEAWV